MALAKGGYAEEMTLSVDARTLPTTGLLYAVQTIPVTKSPMTVTYPRWLPGTHAPSGPVQNIGGFIVTDDVGHTIQWQRDSKNPYCFHLTPPAGVTKVSIALTYIANQPTENSNSIDIVSTKDFSLINWNCVLVVPESGALTSISAQITLPDGWRCVGSLPLKNRSDTSVIFSSLSVTELIDHPVLIGSRLDDLQLHPADDVSPEVMIHVADTAKNHRFNDEQWLVPLRRLPTEASLLFGGAWYPRYDFYLMFDVRMGLEHVTCSANGMPADSSVYANSSLHDRELLAHEFAHSWVGKSRRPEGMLTADYETVPVFDSLWVYEGLTQYLGGVLAVRSGLSTREQWRSALTATVGEFSAKPGRNWRSLRDICRSGYLLRGRSPHHAELRRNQDYYQEGALFWLSADMRIRKQSGGTRSLDDVCRIFFGPHGKSAQDFTEQQLITALNTTSPADWTNSIHRWIDEVGNLDQSFLVDSGWRMEDTIATTTTLEPEKVTKEQLRKAIGMVVDDGWVQEIIPASTADSAQVRVGDFIYSVNDRELQRDPDALERAVLGSPTKPSISLYVCRNNRDWETRVLNSAVGIRQSRLVRVEGTPDRFAAILAPRSPMVAVAQPVVP